MSRVTSNDTAAPRVRVWRTIALAMAVAIGCAEAPVKPPPSPPPEPRFEPAPGAIQVELYERLRFEVFDERGARIEAEWFVADALQGEFYEFEFQPTVAGDLELRAAVLYAGKEYAEGWQLAVSDINSSETPPVTVIRMEPGAVPGSVDLFFERPPTSLVEVPLRQSIVYWSDAPIPSDDLTAANEVFLAIDEEQLEQSYTIDGLVERASTYVRVVIEDILDRRSRPSAQSSAPSTGHFDLTGSVRFIRVLQDVLPMENALIELGDEREVSDSGGNFGFLAQPSFPGFPGYTPPPGPILRVSDSSGVNFYNIVSQEELSRVDQRFDLLMLPREVLSIHPLRPEDPNLIDLLDFVLLMTRNARAASVLNVPRWEEYPVTVYAPSLVLQSANGSVDYRLAFQRAIDDWNAAAGEELLHLAPEAASPGIGIVYAADLGPSDNLGETVMIEPIGGNLFRDIPELIRIRLRSFSSQAIADQIISHEIGHALLVDHSPSLGHIMEASVPTTAVHRDEALIARIISHLPQMMDLKWYETPSKSSLRFGQSEGPRLCGTGQEYWESLR